MTKIVEVEYDGTHSVYSSCPNFETLRRAVRLALERPTRFRGPVRLVKLSVTTLRGGEERA